jgi:hypothetical protein
MTAPQTASLFTAVAVAFALGASAALPTKADTAGCETYSYIAQWMSRMEASGRGAVAELEGMEAASFVSATNSQPLADAYSADKVSIFVAFRQTPTPHGMLGPGGALAILYQQECGTDVLLISPAAMADIVQAARKTPV